MIEFFFSAQSVEALGWTLLHSLWQGAAFAFLLVIMLVALRSYSALSRYVVSVGLFSAFFLTLTTTFFLQLKQANSKAELALQSAYNPTESDALVLNLSPNEVQELNNSNYNTGLLSSNISDTSSNSWLVEFRSYYNRHLPLLVTIWFLGILFLQLRLLGQLAYIQRLKHYGATMFPDTWNDKIQKLESRLQIRRKVNYLTSIRVESPMVIGWLKPVILIPQQLFDSLSETEIYAILAHELAHIRREDFIINLLQTFLCNVFFFHPGVWWMSNRIDDEREHCCDDLAVSATGPASTYAKTLITVSEHRLKMKKNPSLVMAFVGKNKRRERVGFSGRIRRLFLVKNGKGTFREGFATAFILITALFLGVAATESTVHSDDSDLTSERTEPVLNTSDETPNSPELQLNNDIIIETKKEPIANISTIISQNDLPIEAPAPPAAPAAPEYQNDTRVDALVMACGEGDLDFVKSLIQLGINVSSIGSNGFTPLMMAASRQEAEIVAYLLSQGADVNQTYRGWTALLEAADEGSFESMKHLLEAGADVNYYQGPGSPTAISMTASEGKLECMQLLLAHGADIDGIGSSAPPLHFAAEENKRNILDYLISKNVNINKTDADGRTALMYAASEGKMTAVRKLVEAGADISIRDNRGVSAKDYAEYEEKYSISKYLQAENPHDSDVREENTRGQFISDNNISAYKRPRIHQATLDGLIEKVERMVEQGTDVNTTDNYGRTPLHIASAEGYNIDMRVLIDLGANVNAPDNQGRTPLMYAAADGKGDAVALLVSKLADVNIKDVDGMRAYEWGRSGGNSELAKFLGLITRNKNRTEREENRSVRLDERVQREERRIEKSVQKEDQKIQKHVENVQKAIVKGESFHVSESGSHLRQFDIEHGTPELLEIIRYGTLEDCSKLLKEGHTVNTSDDTGQTALMVAARTNRIDIAKFLIDNGADVNMSSASGLTALHYAALEDYDEMARLLLSNNAKVDPTMHYSSTDGNDSQEAKVWEYMGATPLMIAVEAKKINVLSVLIKAGANKNHSLIRNEYILHEDRANYLTGSEVMGLKGDFLQDGELQNSDDTWSPYKQALLLNDAEILDILRNH